MGAPKCGGQNLRREQKCISRANKLGKKTHTTNSTRRTPREVHTWNFGQRRKKNTVWRAGQKGHSTAVWEQWVTGGHKAQKHTRNTHTHTHTHNKTADKTPSAEKNNTQQNTRNTNTQHTTHTQHSPSRLFIFPLSSSAFQSVVFHPIARIIVHFLHPEVLPF